MKLFVQLRGLMQIEFLAGQDFCKKKKIECVFFDELCNMKILGDSVRE
jgi:hypothetical protein